MTLCLNVVIFSVWVELDVERMHDDAVATIYVFQVLEDAVVATYLGICHAKELFAHEDDIRVGENRCVGATSDLIGTYTSLCKTFHTTLVIRHDCFREREADAGAIRKFVLHKDYGRREATVVLDSWSECVSAVVCSLQWNNLYIGYHYVGVRSVDILEKVVLDDVHRIRCVVDQINILATFEYVADDFHFVCSGRAE